MRFKRLNLQGYKTFASKGEFLFDDGLTAIVGPNGSGKSNVADAIRWVLGEQSFSALRGKRNTDMIFSGTAKRAPSGMAEATLILDNTDGFLPIDYSEVAIGRRAYRSGDSEYLLNGNKVRRKDIIQLLATTGLAEQTYTIISQGLVDKVLMLGPEDRRVLFEEAAGISHYKSKRAESLRRLHDTQRNLERVNDLLVEMKPRLGSLRRQAERAEKHGTVVAELNLLLKQWYGYQWADVRKRLKEAEEKSAVSEAAYKKSRKALLELQEKGNSQRISIQQNELRLGEKTKARDILRETYEAARRQVAILTERNSQIEQQLGEINAELPSLKKQESTAQIELNDALAAFEVASSSFKKAKSALSLFDTNADTRQNEIRKWQKSVETIGNSLRQAQTHVDQKAGQLEELQQRLVDAEKQAAEQANANQDSDVTEQLATLAAATQTAKTALAAVRETRSTMRQERKTLNVTLDKSRKQIRHQQNELSRFNKTVAKLEARRELIEKSRVDTKSLAGNVDIVDRFINLVTVPKEHSRAIEAALNNQVGTLLVKDEASLWNLVESNQNQAIVAINASKIQAQKSANLPQTDGIIGWANDLITCDAQYTELAQLLLGRALIVSDAKTAYAVANELDAGAMAIAQDGLVVYAGGLVDSSGRISENTIAAREEAWEAINANLEQQKTNATDAQTQLQTLQSNIDKNQLAVTKFSGQDNEQAESETLLSQAFGQAQQTEMALRKEQEFTAKQSSRQAQTLADLKNRIKQTETAVSDHNSKLLVLTDELRAAKEHLSALPVTETAEERTTLERHVSGERTIMAGRQAVADSRRATFNQISEQVRRLDARLTRLTTDSQAGTFNSEQNKLKSLDVELAEFGKILAPLQEDVKTGRVALMQMGDETNVARKQSQTDESAHTQATIILNKCQNQAESIMERVKADMGLGQEEEAPVVESEEGEALPVEPKPEIDWIVEISKVLPTVAELPAGIDVQIQKLRRETQRMGAVNPNAPEEYREMQERFEFLTQQIEDLTSTEDKLRIIIAELDELTSKAFGETVAKVDVEFQKIFTRLFGGGSARLELTNPDDLTLTGVDIAAQLPNKRQQPLNMLSGGERSLTAVALVFSLLTVSPTPFCILDEVDAMLDEANVDRFVELLSELSLQTQFIVITHNRGTVQAAQTIYGISMSDDGSSQMLSIKPEEYLAQGEIF